ALVLPWLRAHVAMETMLVVATALFASTSLGLALVSSIVPALALTFGGGIGWMVVMSTFSIAAQESVPAWGRARRLAVSLLVIQGSLAGGALGWGVVAAHTSLATALLAAGAIMPLGSIFALRRPLHAIAGLDLTPSGHWEDPVVSGTLDPDEGPVLVTVDYRL